MNPRRIAQLLRELADEFEKPIMPADPLENPAPPLVAVKPLPDTQKALKHGFGCHCRWCS